MPVLTPAVRTVWFVSAPLHQARPASNAATRIPESALAVEASRQPVSNSQMGRLPMTSLPLTPPGTPAAAPSTHRRCSRFRISFDEGKGNDERPYLNDRAITSV